MILEEVNDYDRKYGPRKLQGSILLIILYRLYKSLW